MMIHIGLFITPLWNKDNLRLLYFEMFVNNILFIKFDVIKTI